MTAYNVVSAAAMQAGQPEDISVVLANFNAIATVLNGNLDNSNLSAGAAILLSKLAGYPTDGTKFAAGDGTWKAPVAGMAVIFDVQVARGNAGDPVTGATIIDSNTILGGNIPATYKHLLMILSTRSNAAGGTDGVYMRFNADATANYDYQYDYGGNVTWNAPVPGNGQAAMFAGYTAGNTLTAGFFGENNLWIPSYADAIRKKHSSSEFTVPSDAAAGMIIGKAQQNWRNTVALTRIQLAMGNWQVSQFMDGSRATLYGMP